MRHIDAIQHERFIDLIASIAESAGYNRPSSGSIDNAIGGPTRNCNELPKPIRVAIARAAMRFQNLVEEYGIDLPQDGD